MPPAVGVAVAVATAMAIAANGVAAATIHVEAARQGEAIEIRAHAELDADAATAWRVLTDYGRYAEFIPDLRLSRVVARRGATVVVEQSGDATLWLFRMPLDVTFEIDERAPDHLESRAISGGLRALVSTYALTSTGSRVRLDYTGRVTPGFALFGYFEEIAVRSNLMRQFQALADEIERSAGTARGARPLAR